MNNGLFDYLLWTAEKILGKFSSPQDKLFKLQYLQYEWVRVVMEQAKRERAFCSGLIFWMMNDCWPASSGWAFIDYYNLPKNAYYSFKRCAKPVIASIDSENGVYRVYIINDGEEKRGEASLKILSADRTSVKEYKSLSFSAKKYSSSVVFEDKAVLADGEALICDIECGDIKDRAFYSHGALNIIPTKVEVDIDTERCTLCITAKGKYVHAVTVSGNAVFEDNCFSLLPGESRTLSFRWTDDSDRSLTVDAYTLA
jgi:beta-mannosidase